MASGYYRRSSERTPHWTWKKNNNKWTLWYVNFDMHTEAVFIDASLLCKCRSATRITEMLVKTGQTHATDNNTKL